MYDSRFSLLKKPSAYVPIAMSMTGLALVIGHVLIYGLVHETDEGAAAHIFQLLIGLQVPIVGYFALRWLPVFPRKAIAVLILQAAAVLAAFASVFLLERFS